LVRLRVVLLGVVLALPLVYVMDSLFFAGGGHGSAHGHFQPGSHVVDPRTDSIPFSLSFDGDGPINMTEDRIAVKGYDVVAYFTEDRPVEGSPEITAEWEDAIFQFSSEENRDRFLEAPEDYIPAYGGYCALGVANGYKDDMHPAAFDVIDGRLFFNLTPGIHASWAGNSERLIARADENWPELKTAPGYGRADGR